MGDPTFEDIFQKQKINCFKLKHEPLKNRKRRLKELGNWVINNETRIQKTLEADKGFSLRNTQLFEIYPIMTELRTARRKLKYWVRPKFVRSPLPLLTATSYVIPEPKGVCLIISPWNFFHLTFLPLISALAAGNTVIIKPSEISKESSKLIKEMVQELFEPDLVYVFEGGADVSTALLNLPFNHIHFTGSPAVGKIIMEAAAKNLSSVTLELGGKNPAVLFDACDLNLAAKRIAWGKFINAGQACISIDYVLVQEDRAEEFIEIIQKEIIALYESEMPTDNWVKIINENNFYRLVGYKNEAIEMGAKCIELGTTSLADRYIPPTIFTNVSEDCKLRKEEIFGPYLPIVTYSDKYELLDLINKNEYPLTAYVFTKKDEDFEFFRSNVASGSIVKNDTYIYYINGNLPFGGINNSGFGSSHGKYGFLDFSHLRSVTKQSYFFNLHSIIYPPYTKYTDMIINFLIRYF